MSKILWMVEKNLPLGHHEKYSQNDMETRVMFGGEMFGYNNQKKLDRIASAIVNGLSQYSVADLVAGEWDSLPPQVRMAVTNLANTSNHSGNVNKGIAYLDKKLGGRFKRITAVQTERVLRTGADGRLYRDTRAINQAQAAASRAFAIVARPANYDRMTPQQKRKVNEELARARRNR